MLEVMDVAARMVSDIVLSALSRGATTIRVEPLEAGVRVRLRVGGVLEEAMMLPRAMQHSIVGRIKNMATLDIAETRLPQDGRIVLALRDTRVAFAVSTLPTVLGESVTFHRLGFGEMSLDLGALGLPAGALQNLRRALRAPSAMVVFSGHTFSGCHTMAYASIAELRAPDLCVATVEAPVRRALDGVDHVQVDDDRGLDFAACLRAVARIEPDVIMLGELIDRETVQLAVAEAIRGARIVGSIHTHDAPGVLARFVNMDIEPWAMASIRPFIQAQRLLRKLCDACKKPLAGSAAARTAGLAGLGLPRDEAVEARVFEPAGCEACGHTGYKGQVLAIEQLAWGPELERAVLRGAGPRELAGVAIEAGMQTLRRSALDRMLAGTTSPSEVARCTPPRPAWG